MRKYEGLFIFPPDEAPETGKEEEKRIEEMISRFGGRTLERQDWGRRPLGYPLRKFREGRILVLNFEMETRQIAELKKTIQLEEKILKSTVVVAPQINPPKETQKNPRSEGSHARQPQ